MTHFNRVLIANRGEIAVRIIRACKEMNIETVAVYSTADKDSLHAALADYAICIGTGSPKDSYLNLERIMSTAVTLGVDAIHPGYGFLSENSRFAKMCEECGIIFIGPDSDAILNMGNKSTARELMKSSGVPVIPGSDGLIHDMDQALVVAKEIGFPVIIKASMGGGGKGMRIVNTFEDLSRFIDQAKNEAQNAFGDSSIYIEKYITESRHVEFQILADKHGNTIHLFDRECSIQRNNQKMIEEAPSSYISDVMRKNMGDSAVLAAKAIDYNSAGTVEFLVDNDNNYYFIEMNTRIQVEHPTTEMVTGIDLIKEQIKIARGDKLTINQEDVIIRGHSIECRINAEDPDNHFAPSAGTITDLHLPGGNGVRVDTHLYPGYKIPVYYDSMLCKIICWGNDRSEAIQKMKVALDELVVSGIKTNTSLQKRILSHPDFLAGEFNTNFVNKIIG
ncbi:acetyl-CoA carboxylase biotin carboxylase subunit [Alkalibacter saccharofermentans]|uniref:Biotin carboxylase n=1 Tax=Alkalibacter saccharofermentans DSM 14828 TaxID=1120975 RepID=A0A1M4VWY2_9FIRM|nr:acetyl-CoA carboxylase biotin carboxylase subunit [Alkalibacter saccharofermentans]SHE73373.1 acetyl-CoA carboxylase, biotin carboxylase subunit [Alkalibacter saccharofermentans DSM 14828]